MTWRLRVLIAVSVLGVLAYLPAALSAAGSAPTVDQGSAECDVEPRSFDEIVALIGTPIPGSSERAAPVPEAVPRGHPADAATSGEIRAAALRLIACYNTDDPRRIFALYSDDLLRRIGPLDATALDDLATPTPPRQGAALLVLEAVEDVEVLDDGRVRAVVVQGVGGGLVSTSSEVSVVVFVRANDRWVVDDIVEEVARGDQAVAVEDLDRTPEPAEGRE